MRGGDRGLRPPGPARAMTTRSSNTGAAMSATCCSRPTSPEEADPARRADGDAPRSRHHRPRYSITGTGLVEPIPFSPVRSASRRHRKTPGRRTAVALLPARRRTADRLAYRRIAARGAGRGLPQASRPRGHHRGAGLLTAEHLRRVRPRAAHDPRGRRRRMVRVDSPTVACSPRPSSRVTRTPSSVSCCPAAARPTTGGGGCPPRPRSSAPGFRSAGLSASPCDPLPASGRRGGWSAVAQGAGVVIPPISNQRLSDRLLVAGSHRPRDRGDAARRPGRVGRRPARPPRQPFVTAIFVGSDAGACSATGTRISRIPSL